MRASSVDQIILETLSITIWFANAVTASLQSGMRMSETSSRRLGRRTVFFGFNQPFNPLWYL
jgi:hypothetical protein